MVESYRSQFEEYVSGKLLKTSQVEAIIALRQIFFAYKYMIF